MTKVRFHLNIHNDVKNRCDALKSSSYGVNWSNHIPQSIKAELQNKTKKEQKEILTNHINQLYKQFQISMLISKYNIRRKDNGIALLQQMKKIVQKEIPVMQLNVYITTINRCPYDPQNRSHMYCPLREGDCDTNPSHTTNAVLHEVLHMMVHYYYEDYIRQHSIDNNQFHILKEAQTVILNEEYNLPRPDNGYDSHQLLRGKLLQFRRRNKDFRKFLDYGIGLIKETNI